MPKDLRLLSIPDLIWIDYIGVVLWTRAKHNKDASFILGKDFPIINNIQITFGIIIEMYALEIIEKVEINKNMRRILTLENTERGNLQKDIESGQKNFAILYDLLDSITDTYDIIVYPKKKPLAKFLNKRLNQWLSNKSYQNTTDSKSIENQKRLIGNELVLTIKERELMGKNIKFSCGKFIYDSDKQDYQDLIVSEINPFLVLYSFEKEKLIELIDTDFDTIKLSVKADLMLEIKKKLLSEETVYNYGFTIPINKKKDGIYFDEKSGEVFKSGISLGRLSINTREYKLFQFLYSNQGEFQNIDTIVKELSSIQDEKLKIIPDIKRRTPKGIRDLIKSSKGNYRLLSDKEILP